MGYTTTFDGAFTLDRKLDDVHASHLLQMYDNDDYPDGNPSSYCQWVPTEDGLGIEWDGEEKFYNYIEWLEFLIEHFLRPWGHVLSGEVKWSGEDVEDAGVISVKNNIVSTREVFVKVQEKSKIIYEDAKVRIIFREAIKGRKEK